MHAASNWVAGSVPRATVVATVVRQPWSQLWSRQPWSGNLFLQSRETLGIRDRGRVHNPHFEPRRYSLSPVLRAQRVRRGLEVGMSPAPCPATVVATVVRQPWSREPVVPGNRESGNLFRRGRHSGSGRGRVHTPHFEPRRHSLSPVLRAQGVRPGLEVGMAAAWVGRIMAAGGWEESRAMGFGEEMSRGFGGDGGSADGRARLRWQDANAREP